MAFTSCNRLFHWLNDGMTMVLNHNDNDNARFFNVYWWNDNGSKWGYHSINGVLSQTYDW